ncbi:MAG: zinc-ribbon domain-containing protein, partial [Christensenellaceae bacterium]|nr:zinc-ribbon domain-containing protein [Christensenellaceae bacterium]
MFCRFCGKELADDAIFCDACGKKLHDDAEAVQKEPVQPKENSQVKKPKKKLFVTIGIVLAAVILIAAVFFIGYSIVSGIEVKMPDPVAFFDVEG